MESALTVMGYSVDELILATIILVIVIGDAVKNRNKTYYGHQLLRIAAFSYTLNLFGALQWAYTNGRPDTIFHIINWLGCAATILMPLIFSASCALYIDYAIHQSKTIAKRSLWCYYYIFSIILIIFFVSLPFNSIFFLDDNNVYQRGFLLPFYFLFPLFFQLYAIGQIFKNRNQIATNTLNIYVLLLICGMVICGFVRQWVDSSNELLFFHSIAMVAMFLKVSSDAQFEKEKLYKTCFDGLNVAMAIFDAKGCYEYTNPFYLKNAKIPLSDKSLASVDHFIHTKIVGKTRDEILNDQTLQLAEAFYRANGQHVFQGMLDFDDKVFFITLLDVMVLEESYRVVCFNDMTNYTQVKNKLDESITRTNLYEKAFESADYGISIFSSKEKINYINKYYANLIYGKEPQELINGDVFSPCDTPEKIKKWRQAFNKAIKNQSGQISMPSNGQLHDFFYNVIPVYDTVKKETNYICLLQNITKTKIMEKQIIEQVQRLESLSKTKDEFIANVSHEIRTPINAIIGMIYFMKNTALSQEQINYLTKIDNAAGVLLSLVNDVLDFSKFNANKIILKDVPFKIFPVVESVKAMFESTCQKKGISLSAYYDFDINLAVCGDKLRFSQVILNFVSNAVKFTNQGSVDIHVCARETGESRVKLEVSIKDTGVGILPEDLERVWQSFEQVDNSLSKRYQGTGLGLAIAKQIVTQMGGEIGAESAINKGSIFSFSVEMEKSQNIIEERIFMETTKADIVGRRILLVEDNEINAEIAGMLIEELGLSYDLAVDGIDAINHCQAHRADYYDLILMDIQMPRMNGYEASLKIKSELNLPVPIIALSATVENDEMQEKYKEYIDGYLTKPIQPVFLKENLQRLLLQAKPNETGNVTTSAKKTSSLPPGLDEVLERLGGNETLLRHLLLRFRIENENAAEKIRYLYLDGNFDDLLVLLSHLRNSAKNLNLAEIDESVNQLIWALKNDTVVSIEKYTNQIQKAMDTLFSWIH